MQQKYDENGGYVLDSGRFDRDIENSGRVLTVLLQAVECSTKSLI